MKDPKAPYTIWEHDDEETASKWGPCENLVLARAYLLRIKRGAYGANAHIRDCYRQKVILDQYGQDKQ